MKQKGFASIFILAGILVLVALGGVYYLNKSSVKPIPQPQITVSPTVQPTTITNNPEATNSAEIANWKVYATRNFSFEYPSDSIYKVNSSEWDVDYSLVKFTNKKSDTDPGFLYFDLEIHIVQNTTDLKSWINNYAIQNLPTGKKRSIIQGGITEFETNSIKGFTFDGGKEELAKYVFFKQGDSVIVFTLYPHGTGGDYRQDPKAVTTFDQILSTFKFTN